MDRVACTTHEAVWRLDRRDLGLTAFIAIHSTRLGPAFGGARLWRYADETSALTDALRLSEGMTYKNAMADLGAGGGKSVLMLRDLDVPREAVFEAFGKALESLQGTYITAEDVGTTTADMQAIRRVTRHVAGLPAQAGEAGGDPSPWTALGVWSAMRTAAASRGLALDGLTVAVQGCGAVGAALCGLLAQSGVKLKVSDIASDRAMAMRSVYGAEIVDPGKILQAPADIFAPCGLGGVLAPASLPQLGAKIVVGAANNQLLIEEMADRLADAGVLYVPDYVANAGGIICVMAEHRGELGFVVEDRVRAIGLRVGGLLAEALRTGRSPYALAKLQVDALLDLSGTHRCAPE
jgi:leucine dehydrogenase